MATFFWMLSDTCYGITVMFCYYKAAGVEVVGAYNPTRFCA